MSTKFIPIIFYTRLNKWIGQKRPFLLRLHQLDKSMFITDYSIELGDTVANFMNRIVMFKSGYNEIKIGRIKLFEYQSNQYKIEILYHRNEVPKLPDSMWIGKQNILVVLRFYNQL